MDPTRKTLIAALLEERRQLVQSRRHRRIGEVDKALIKLGHIDPAIPTAAAPSPPPAAQPEPPMETTQQAPPDHAALPAVDDHVCTDCGRTFKTPAALGSHSRVHKADDAD